MIMVLAMIAVGLAISFAMVRTAYVHRLLASRQSGSFEAGQVADAGACLALKQLEADPTWMPDPNPMAGKLGSDGQYEVELAVTEQGTERLIRSVGQVADRLSGQVQAKRTTVVELSKQPTDVQPRAAIMAFGSQGVAVQLQAAVRIEGDVWARGTIMVQSGVELAGQVREQASFGLGWPLVDPAKLTRYWTPGGEQYQAYDLAAIGASWQQEPSALATNGHDSRTRTTPTPMRTVRKVRRPPRSRCKTSFLAPARTTRVASTSSTATLSWPATSACRARWSLRAISS